MEIAVLGVVMLAAATMAIRVRILWAHDDDCALIRKVQLDPILLTIISRLALTFKVVSNVVCVCVPACLLCRVVVDSFHSFCFQ